MQQHDSHTTRSSPIARTNLQSTRSTALTTPQWSRDTQSCAHPLLPTLYSTRSQPYPQVTATVATANYPLLNIPITPAQHNIITPLMVISQATTRLHSHKHDTPCCSHQQTALTLSSAIRELALTDDDPHRGPCACLPHPQPPAQLRPFQPTVTLTRPLPSHWKSLHNHLLHACPMPDTAQHQSTQTTCKTTTPAIEHICKPSVSGHTFSITCSTSITSGAQHNDQSVSGHQQGHIRQHML